VVQRNLLLHEVVDFLCLVYHEARNVRHLIKKSLIDGAPYKALVNLPTGRDEARAAMAPARREAARASSAESAARVFHRRFSRSLDELEELYRAPL